jgi:hypothetical protein
VACVALLHGHSKGESHKRLLSSQANAVGSISGAAAAP